ncbi:unnamed protein product, partial [Closterium sp. Yama58-4]
MCNPASVSLVSLFICSPSLSAAYFGHPVPAAVWLCPSSATCCRPARAPLLPAFAIMATLLAKTSSRFTVKLLTALLAATLLLPSTNAATYPNCPLTGKPPTTPTVPPTRCVVASNLTCCAACSDINFAVQALAVNVTAAVEAAAGGIIDVSTVPNSICPIMKGHEMCERLVEQLACAVQCNPDSGNYLTGKPGKYMLQICTDHAQAIYDACSSLEVAGFVVSDAFVTPEDIIQQLLVPLVAQQIPGFNATVTDTACYSGPTVIPVTPLCCDPLNIPATCPPGAVNMTAAKNFCQGALPSAAMRRIGSPWSPILVRRTLAEVAGTLETAQLALEYGLACSTAGGTHHAFRGHGSGYCILNDLAVTAAALTASTALPTPPTLPPSPPPLVAAAATPPTQEATKQSQSQSQSLPLVLPASPSAASAACEGEEEQEDVWRELLEGAEGEEEGERAAMKRVQRVAIVDLDVHQGDGTAAILSTCPSVFTFSMHCGANFPAVKQSSDLDVDVPEGAGDAQYLALLADHLPSVLASFRPDLVLYDAGVDPHEGDALGKYVTRFLQLTLTHKDDALGKLCLTDQGLFRRDMQVIDTCVGMGIPVAAYVGGGYHRDIQ